MDDRSAFDPHSGRRSNAAGGPSKGADTLKHPLGKKPAGKKGHGKTGKKPAGADTSSTEDAVPAERSIADLAKDWIGLWQSELAALMTDREAQENWQAMLALWSGAASTMFRPMPNAEADGARRQPQSPGPKRPAAPAAAPDVRDAEIDRLSRCIAELERRLADVERRTGQHAADRRKPDRAGRQR